jgi:hypothetical protein
MFTDREIEINHALDSLHELEKVHQVKIFAAGRIF